MFSERGGEGGLNDGVGGGERRDEEGGRGGGGGMVQQGQRRVAETYTIITQDSYEDSWNGGELSVTGVESGGVVATSTGPANGCKYHPPGDTCERTETVSLDCRVITANARGSSRIVRWLDRC